MSNPIPTQILSSKGSNPGRRSVPKLKQVLPNIDKLKDIAKDIPKVYDELKRKISEFEEITNRARQAVIDLEVLLAKYRRRTGDD